MKSRNRVIFLILSIIGVFLIGIVGFMIIEKASFFDSLYMTVITISSVGYSDILNLTPLGRVFNMFLILAGISVVIYSLSSITTYLIEGELREFIKGAKLKKMIKNLTDHNIICGSGSTAYKIIENFIISKEKFIVIDNDKEKLEFFKREFGDELLLIESNPNRDEILLEAGIKKAKTLISVLPTDAENLFVSLSAKSLNNSCVIVTRAMDYNNESKFHKAGADYIISPNKIAANRISNIISKKNIFDYLDLISKNDIDDFGIEFITVPENSILINKELREAKIPQLTGLNVIGIEKNGKIQMNPLSDTVIELNSKLLVFGNSYQLIKLEELINTAV